MDTGIQMVDLRGQYHKIKQDIDSSIRNILESTSFIGGTAVQTFSTHLSSYLGGAHVVTCANGTDALQIALMSLGLKPGDEVIVPAFTYVASAEAIALLGITPVMVDVDQRTFNITSELIEPAITPRTRAIIPVHLYGQCCSMEGILDLAKKNKLYVIEDNAQAIGAEYTFSNGQKAKSGTMGDYGCTSFFPSKNLGCYGDGGAITTGDSRLADLARMVANHGQSQKYHHAMIGCNSRLDAIQAAVLDAKLPHLDEYTTARRCAARRYNELLSSTPLILPYEQPESTHVYHQYTVRVPDGKRDALRAHLASRGIPSMVYYPLPLHRQQAFQSIARTVGSMAVSSMLCTEVLSLPMHTELTDYQQQLIAQAIIEFYHK